MSPVRNVSSAGKPRLKQVTSSVSADMFTDIQSY